MRAHLYLYKVSKNSEYPRKIIFFFHITFHIVLYQIACFSDTATTETGTVLELTSQITTASPTSAEVSTTAEVETSPIVTTQQATSPAQTTQALPSVFSTTQEVTTEEGTTAFAPSTERFLIPLLRKRRPPLQSIQ